MGILITMEISLLTLYMIHISLQYFRKRKNLTKSKVEIIKIKTYDSDAYVVSFLLIYIVYRSWSQLNLMGNEFNYLVLCFLISIIAIIKIVELFKPLRIHENGIYSGNRFIDWNDIIEYRWQVVYTDKIERLTVKTNRKTLFHLLKEFNLKVNITIENKMEIDEIIKEKIAGKSN